MVYDYSALKGRIKEKFDTQEQFAEALGLTAVSVSDKLNNKKQWRQWEIDRAAKALGIPPDEISLYFFKAKV